MWKKPDDTIGAQQPQFASKQTPEPLEMTLDSASETLVDAYRDSRAEKPKLVRKVLAGQPLSPPSMATYTEAVNEFTKNATAFIEQLPLLTRARDSYEQAIRASAELRKILDTGEENLRTLMSHLEQAVDPTLDRKKPEPMKVEAIRGTDESAGVV
jgi:exonuclease VII small subunit